MSEANEYELAITSSKSMGFGEFAATVNIKTTFVGTEQEMLREIARLQVTLHEATKKEITRQFEDERKAKLRDKMPAQGKRY